MSYPPRAFIIGAQKAATTSLAFLLDQHPAIQLSSPKEPHFFSTYWDKGEAWYRTQFPAAADDVMLLDASTSYAMAPIAEHSPPSSRRPRWGQSVPERIRGVASGAKFIYLLRRPADRTYSAYWHNIRSGNETLPFREAIDAHPVYLETSKYHAQLLVYLKHFELDDFLLIDFKAFSNDPEKYARQCLNFLEVPQPDFKFALDVEKNKSFQYNNAGRMLQKLLGSEHTLKFINSLVKRCIPTALHGRLKSLISQDIPAMTDADRAYLEDYFASENDKLRELTGFEFE
ncbi:MAG: hypothetical protein GKS00_15220 [Alphaproteobacteria bacterium]|nr:hypothetical protein [Alphaproteobacteria bacterium]